MTLKKAVGDEHFFSFILRPCQHADGYIDGRSQINADERISDSQRSSWDYSNSND